jgi:hypothetical protein
MPDDFPSMTLSRPMPGYQRPDPDDTAMGVKASARPKLSTATPIRKQRTCTPIEQAHHAILDAPDRFESDWRNIAAAEQRGELPPKGRAKAVFTVTPTNAIDQAMDQAADRAMRSDQAYTEARNRLSAHPPPRSTRSTTSNGGAAPSASFGGNRPPDRGWPPSVPSLAVLRMTVQSRH